MTVKERSFYEEIQNCTVLDLRDIRGRVHDLGLVLMGVLLGILRKRDGTLSSIHRSMVNTHSALCAFLGIPVTKVVSRSHLPVLLQKVDVEVFDSLLFKHYGMRLNKQAKDWFSGDGKELRGSIASGKTRGQAVVQIVNHRSGEVIAQNYYDGQKESEIPTLRKLLSNDDIASQKITLDALHLCPDTTDIIAKAGGVFLIGLKENQSALLAHMTKCVDELPSAQYKKTFDFNHGRFEAREYWSYDISNEKFDQRWDNTGFKSLVKTQRTRVSRKTGKTSQETSYYISNGTKEEGLVEAARGHWSVEVNNHIRDVTLSEDQFKSKKKTCKGSLLKLERWLSTY